MNNGEAKHCLEKAAQHLRDARNSALSPDRRFQCAHRAARECTMALAAATNDRSAFAEHTLCNQIQRLLYGLALAPNIWLSATAWLDQSYLKSELASSELNLAVVQSATRWAAILHADATKRVTRNV